jgi:D-tyrosyl-tRNA(Tyr) deacylase
MCRLVIQRVLRGRVTVGERTVGEIGRGLVVLLGVHREDTREDVRAAVVKMCRLRLFGKEGEAEGERWSASVTDQPGLSVLLVSQFTLNASFKGRKPVFSASMAPQLARELFDYGVTVARQELGSDARVQTGAFGERMQVELVNDGPVTIVLDSKDKKTGGAIEEEAGEAE